MITAILWQDSTSDTCPMAWSNFNHDDYDGAMEWIDQQRRNYSAGFARIFRKSPSGRQLLMCQESWSA